MINQNEKYFFFFVLLTPKSLKEEAILMKSAQLIADTYGFWIVLKHSRIYTVDFDWHICEIWCGNDH